VVANDDEIIIISMLTFIAFPNVIWEPKKGDS